MMSGVGGVCKPEAQTVQNEGRKTAVFLRCVELIALAELFLVLVCIKHSDRIANQQNSHNISFRFDYYLIIH